MGRTLAVRFSPSSKLMELMIALPGMRFKASSTTSASVESMVIGAGTRVAIFSKMLLMRSEEHTSELQSLRHLVCRLLLEKINPASRFFLDGLDVFVEVVIFLGPSHL